MKQIFFNGSTQLPSTTQVSYTSLLNTPRNYAWQTVAGRKIQLIPNDGTLTYFRVNVETAPTVGKWCFRVIVNGIESCMQAVILPGENEAESVIPIKLSSGDKVELMVRPVDGPESTKAFWSVLYENTSTNKSIYPGGLYDSILPNGIRQSGLFVSDPYSDTQSNLVSMSGVIDTLSVSLQQASGSNGVWYFSIIKNGTAVGNSLISFNNNSPLTKTLTGLNIAIEPGDMLSFQVEPSGTPDSNNRVTWGTTVISNTNGESMVIGGSTSSLITDGNDHYNRLCGTNNNWQTVLGNSHSQVFNGGPLSRLSKLIVNLSSAPGTGNTHTFSINTDGSNGNLEVTLKDNETQVIDTKHKERLTKKGEMLSIRHISTGTPTTSSAKWAMVQTVD